MPSTVLSSVTMVLDSSTVITPSLPTFFIASAMMLPMGGSLLAEIGPTCPIMSPETGFRHIGDAELLLQNDVATLGAKGNLHGIGQLVDAAQNRLTGIFCVDN